jgi:hypothetical protein
MRIHLALAGTAMALFLTLASAEDTHVALIKDVTGSVTVLRAGTSMPAAAGTQLEKSDELVSAAGATAGIVFRDGTLFTLGSGSDVMIKDFLFDPVQARYAFSVYLARGSAIYSSGKIGKVSPDSVIVSTPKAVIGVRGTRFLVTATD